MTNHPCIPWQLYVAIYIQYLQLLYNEGHKSCIQVESPNKGHFGDNINSDVLSFVERLSSLRRFKMY